MFIEKGKENLIVLILKLLIILFFFEIGRFLCGCLEFRSDKFEDDRDPRLDGTIKYTDKDGDTFPFVIVMNSSPTPDNSGKGMYFLFIQNLVPLVHLEMNISLIRSLNL